MSFTQLCRRGFKAFLLALLAQTGLAQNVPPVKAKPGDFFYAQQTSLAIFFAVKKDLLLENLSPQLDGLGFTIASFEDPNVGYVVLKPMVFTAEFGQQSLQNPGISSSTELEFSVLVEPRTSESKSATLNLQDFILGAKSAGKIGQLRLEVLCDNEIAVAAGREKFGEHKYLASFAYNYTTANALTQNVQPFSWQMDVYVWQSEGTLEQNLFAIKVDLAGLNPQRSNFTKEQLYSSFPPEPNPELKRQAVGEFRFYQPYFQAYFPGEQRNHFAINYGQAIGAKPLRPVPPFGNGAVIPGSENWPKLGQDLIRRLLQDNSPKAYLLFQPSPVEYESSPTAVFN